MKKLPAPGALELGADAVRHLLPHRPPLLLVDRVHAYAPTEAGVGSRLAASKFISSSEPVFAGHFPQLSLWPGVYTIEGLGQACNLLYVLLGVQRALRARGMDPDLLLHALRNAERGFTLAPGFDPGRGSLDALLPDHRTRMGMAAQVEIKLLVPVFAGTRLDYAVELLAEPAPFIRCGVQASVGGVVVARGELTSTTAVPALPAAP